MIVHASKDENGKYKNGTLGDQLQKADDDILNGEVCMRTWYNRPWTAVYEPPSESKGKTIASKAKAAAKNRNIGYDQNRRNTLFKELKNVNYEFNRVENPCACDCSSLATALVIASKAGSESTMIVDGNAATSTTIGSRLKKNGWKEHKEDRYTKSPDLLGEGWILVYEGHHVAVNLIRGDKYGK